MKLKSIEIIDIFSLVSNVPMWKDEASMTLIYLEWHSLSLSFLLSSRTEATHLKYKRNRFYVFAIEINIWKNTLMFL